MDYEKELEDKIVVVTGGGQGIGRCIAAEYAKRKAVVVICSRTKPDLDKAAEEIRSSGGHCKAYAADVSDARKLKQFFDDVIKKYGRIDVLINCAGIYGPIGPLEENDMGQWEKTIQINLLGTVHCTRYVIPVMKKQGKGKIINLCGGGVGGPDLKSNLSAYITSKAAIAGYTEAMANELRDYNIQVNAISPGAVNTRLLDQVLAAGDLAGKDFLERSKKQKSAGGTPPEKAADLAIFLSTSASDHVTGKVLSAVWDDYKNFGKIRDRLKGSLYNLRRIDDYKYKEI